MIYIYIIICIFNHDKNEYTPRPHWADGTPAWDQLPPEKQLAAMEIEISSYGNRCDHQ